MTIDFAAVRNPLWRRHENARDPGLIRTDDGYRIYYTRHASVLGEWQAREVWSVGCIRTRDFVTFFDDRDISPKGFNSPSDPVWWHGRWILGYQDYVTKPELMYFAESADLNAWSSPRPLLPEVGALPWNILRRAIDPHFWVEGDTLHCFFTGAAPNSGETQDRLGRYNMVGQAVTQDPSLQNWTILTREKPLIGETPEGPDGVENIAIVETGDHFTMIYSEGLRRQHLARATSRDLLRWELQGRIDFESQAWMRYGQGAPTVWRENDHYYMLAMGTAPRDIMIDGRYRTTQAETTLGLFHSPDCIQWTPAAER